MESRLGTARNADSKPDSISNGCQQCAEPPFSETLQPGSPRGPRQPAAPRMLAAARYLQPPCPTACKMPSLAGRRWPTGAARQEERSWASAAARSGRFRSRSPLPAGAVLDGRCRCWGQIRRRRQLAAGTVTLAGKAGARLHPPAALALHPLELHVAAPRRAASGGAPSPQDLGLGVAGWRCTRCRRAGQNHKAFHRYLLSKTRKWKRFDGSIGALEPLLPCSARPHAHGFAADSSAGLRSCWRPKNLPACQSA